MAGHRFIVGGDAVMARNTVYSTLEVQGFTLTQIDDWTARAERGSKGASIALGAFAGKEGRHVMLDISCQAAPDGSLAITLMQGTSGMSGGLIGMKQAKTLYADIYNSVGMAFQSAGVLISGGDVK